MSEQEIVSRKDWLKEEINERRIELKRLIASMVGAKSETGDDLMVLQEEIDRVEQEVAELEADLKIEEGKEIIKLPPFVVNDRNPVMSFAENIDWSIAILDIPRIHREFGLTGKGVKVAVLDTACDLEHEDLQGAVIETHNTTSEPYPKNRDSFNGHGIATASLIGARRNNMGILSVAPECQIIAIKCLMESGSGTMVDITEAINLAVDRGAHIINLSLGGASSTPSLEAAVKRAAARGIYVICAAGNSGGDNTVGYPGRYEQAYAVAAINSQKRVSAFSSRGMEVDISAPGERVLCAFKNSGYATISGTSFSSPVVAGCFALFKQAGIKADWQMIKDTAIDIEEPGHDTKSGHGLINPYKIVQKYYKKLEEPPVLPPSAVKCEAPVVVVSNLTPTSAKFEWPTASAFNYHVFFGTNVDILRDKVFELTGLQPNTRYSIGVRCNCSDGISAVTQVEFTTKSLSPPNPPQASTSSSSSPSASTSSSPSESPEKPIENLEEAIELIEEADRLLKIVIVRIKEYLAL